MVEWTLGIASSHDGAACLLKNSEIHTAIREERLTGVKHQRIYGGQSSLSVRYCLDAAGIEPNQLSAVAVANQQAASNLENDLTLNPDLRQVPNLPRYSVSHHLAHAYSAVALSGYKNCAVLICDGQGSPLKDVEITNSTQIYGPRDGYEHLTLYRAQGGHLEPLEIHSCHKWIEKKDVGLWGFQSLGGMYAAVSQLIFGSINAAGKVMGLAPYGKPTFAAEHFLSISNNEFIFTDLPHICTEQFNHNNMSWEQKTNLAASVQAALEEALLIAVKHLKKLSSETKICVAGGVMLNCTAMQKIIQKGGFDDCFIVPAADDAGTAIGAAFHAHWMKAGYNNLTYHNSDALGKLWDNKCIEDAIARIPGIRAEKPNDLLDQVATRIVNGEIGGWMNGPSEFGPRALGQRSIIASPLIADMKEQINTCVKFREAFRPFAPAITEKSSIDWFDFGTSPNKSPFMQRAVPIRQERAKIIPAVTHFDGSGRLQTLTAERNGRFFYLVYRLMEITGIPIIVNTSFNISDEPIVETPEDAIWTLLGTSLCFCVVGDYIVTKSKFIDSILDLTPTVIARSWNIRLPVCNGRLGRESFSEDAFEVEVATPWGLTSIIVPPHLTTLLSTIDGISNGHELVQRINKPDLDDQHFIRSLLLLRRMRVIALGKSS